MIKNDKIFVSGGCGFIGSNFIIDQIQNYNNEILNYDKLTYAGNKSNLKSINSINLYSFQRGDICNADLLSDAIFDFKPNYVVHFAAESHVDRSIEDPLKFVETNVVGTATLLNVCLEYYNQNNDFRFLHVSTDEVYGSLGKNGFFTENTSYSPNSPYAASKASSDHLVRAWGETFNFPYNITNCSNNYGPFQFPEKLIPLIIANCVDNKPLPVYGKGENIRDWLYVKDHCRAIYKVLKSNEIGETFNIGGNNEIKNIDIVTKICEILDKLLPNMINSTYC